MNQESIPSNRGRVKLNSLRKIQSPLIAEKILKNNYLYIIIIVEKETWWWEKSKQASKSARKIWCMKTHSKSTGEFVDLARECTITHTHTLSLSLHRQIDFAITFKLVRRVKYSKKQPKTNFHRLSQDAMKKATPYCSVKKQTLSSEVFF